jgi:glucose-6-phosphate 1-dehydrogenase
VDKGCGRETFWEGFKTAQELDELLGKLFAEEQIYRIDHYLGKETVQNILAFRFSNSFLQDSWNTKGIERIHIRLLETEGVGTRGGFYDGTGALRDVGQNHLLQILALFLMENPEKFDGNSIREKRREVLKALRILTGEDLKLMTIRGQYAGYQKEQEVQPGSQTETYFKIQAFVDNSRWKGVPLILEGGKGLGEDLVQVEVTFRHPAPCLCPPEEGKHYKNILYYSIQPKEEISIAFWVKKPGPAMILEQKEFSFDYRKAFGEEPFAPAYERLLLSVLRGDQTMFVSTEEIMASWKFIDSIIKGWEENEVPLSLYPWKTLGLSV